MQADSCFRVPIFGAKNAISAHVLIDAADLDLVIGRKLRLTRGYAVTTMWVDGSYREVRIARLIMGLERNDLRVVDHISRDKLDNRRANLRICTRAENNQNVSAGRGTSRFRGVSWNRERGIWRAQVQINGKPYRVGEFPSESAAAKAAAAFRREHMPFSTEAAA